MVCKLFCLTLFKGLLICFILTMWYVNNPSLLLFLNKLSGFILTMWYVNNIYDIIHNITARMFYINYVVCKSYLKEILGLLNSVLY